MNLSLCFPFYPPPSKTHFRGYKASFIPITLTFYFANFFRQQETLPLLKSTVTVICACACDVNDVTASFENLCFCFSHSSISTLERKFKYRHFPLAYIDIQKTLFTLKFWIANAFAQLAIILKINQISGKDQRKSNNKRH